MAITTNDTFTSGQILTAQECNNFPFGVVGSVTSNSGNVTVGIAAADISGMSITFTAIAGRTYKFNVMANATSTIAQSFIYLTVTNASNGIIGSVYGNVGANEYTSLCFSNFYTGIAAGSVTFKLRAQAVAASATILRSGNDYLSFWIEDIGTA